MDPLPPCGIRIEGGDAVRDASTSQLVAWLRAHLVDEPRLREVQQLDQGLQGFQRDVLRYGLLKALLDKGYGVARDAAQWAAFDAAMRARLRS